MDYVLYLCNMKYLFKITLACSMVFGFTYTFAYKPNDEKLHCRVCSNTHFYPSNKITKFVGQGDSRVVSTGVFYKCSDCGMVSDVKLN